MSHRAFKSVQSFFL